METVFGGCVFGVCAFEVRALALGWLMRIPANRNATRIDVRRVLVAGLGQRENPKSDVEAKPLSLFYHVYFSRAGVQLSGKAHRSIHQHMGMDLNSTVLNGIAHRHQSSVRSFECQLAKPKEARLLWYCFQTSKGPRVAS